MSKVFIDTNILIYSIDTAVPSKQQTARELLKSLNNKNLGVISTQVLQEFFVAATKKLGVEPLLAKEIMHSLCNFETVGISPEIIMQAVDCSVLNKVSFWDSLIVVSAEHANCECVWTEDLNADQIIRGVRIVNPFV
jgi:predicted nucleic acid-binding protein